MDDTVDTGLLYYDQLNYGDSSVLYQKHGYRVGRYKDLYDNHRNFGKYEFNGLYQKAYKAGQQWTFRLDGQLSSTQYLPSSEMFYLGGMSACGLYGKPDRRGWRLLRQRRIQCTPG